MSQAVGVASAITRYREKCKKFQDWLVIDGLNVHNTLRVQSSDAYFCIKIVSGTFSLVVGHETDL